MKNRYIPHVIASVLVFTLITSPLVTFAKNENKGKDNKEDKNRAAINVSLAATGTNAVTVTATTTKCPTKGWGRLFAPGWLKNFGWQTNVQVDPNCDIPPGIAKKIGIGTSTKDKSDKATSTKKNNLPPVITNISSPTVLNVGQTGTWSVNAYDPENQGLSYSVNWGDSGVQSLMSNFQFVQTATFNHSYANAGTYTAVFTVKDNHGLTTSSTVSVQVNTGTTTTSGPLISNIVANIGATSSQATITWNTDVNSDSRIWVGTSTLIDTATTPAIVLDTLTTNHSVTLNNLQGSTTYYVVVGSKDSLMRTSTSSPVAFTTIAATTTLPVISNANVVFGTNNIQATWTTNVAADSEIYFSTSSPVAIGGVLTTAMINPALVTNHSLNVTGLLPNATYYFIIRSKDVNNNAVVTAQFSLTTLSL